jgi:hypothetical protein
MRLISVIGENDIFLSVTRMTGGEQSSPNRFTTSRMLVLVLVFLVPWAKRNKQRKQTNKQITTKTKATMTGEGAAAGGGSAADVGGVCCCPYHHRVHRRHVGSHRSPPPPRPA